MKARLVLLVPVLALGGCAASSYCEGRQDYQRARSVPVLQSGDGLKVPESDATLRIPPPAPNSAPFAEVVKDEDGDDVVQCLDKPPVMPPVPEPKDPPATPAAEKKPS